ncbi:glycine zipper 2TM domain-containing protein [Caulobacter vibrioides]|uniref:17 kDa surface antigen n=2 Tax=Caulobacter vibrioides TaxID=155892 RepID=Q9A9X2_CAUVC|nr:glycine zipper 2TM domain-containing protein [Caulobacter vibrioides]YP_002516255.1 stress regulated protein OsrP [Caulobacter vibrioides NA1000]AAK22824.1 hypothetical protein CC_0839 [Caulobacter vibrioides CB15]ACL94347.1 stress regulated protein OsrP [Caulobacter vibrioides NA1000]ATC27679.1 glycine zipper 2TM domain-containing protein [Caulobacter vibrioides]AZH12047.1 glycine zipper 2TM domain-containing protein [Caulobacter vibrioides]QXZ52920.1 glycine zipper 2TM domain-containing 
MTSRILVTLLVTTLACGAVAPALAQDAAYQRSLERYNDQRASYDDQVADYRDRQAAYERERERYIQARRDYDRRYGVGAYDRRYPTYGARYSATTYRESAAYNTERARFERERLAYERARDTYDRRRGTGAYDRRHPTQAARFRIDSRYAGSSGYDSQKAQWERDRAAYERARTDYDRRYGGGAYDRRYPDYANRFGTPYAGGYSVDTNTGAECRQDAKRNATLGGVIGALAGAALGSNVAARNARPEGTVLGALVGAGVGAAIGNASAKCDTRGAYYSHDQTEPYRDTDGRYVDAAERCRLAPAPTEYDGRVETRYIRVCPDAEGRYRVQN